MNFEPMRLIFDVSPKKTNDSFKTSEYFQPELSHLASSLNCFSHAYFVPVLLVCCRLWQQRSSRYEYLVAALPPEKPPAVPHMLPASTSLTLGPAALSLVGFPASRLIG